MFVHIISSPEILNGKPHIVDTRLSVEYILELFASGATIIDILKNHPQLTAEAIDEVLLYAEQFQNSVEHILKKNSELYKRLS